MVAISLTIIGAFKTILLILGGFVLLRFLGQFMIAKRNMEEERQLNKKAREFEQERNSKLKNFGKTSIVSGRKSNSGTSNVHQAEDVDFEEIK